MSNIQWWRSWHGAPTDHKWSVIAARSGVKPGIVSAIVWALLDYASQHKERGCVDGFDTEVYSVFSGFSEAEILSVMAALEDKGVLAGGRFCNWEKRQPKREDDSSERVARHREMKRGVTQCNAEKESVTPDSLSSSLSDSLSESYIDIESEKDEDKRFAEIRKIIERETGLLGDGATAVQAIDEMMAAGCTGDDIIAGIKWRIGEGKRITSYSQITGPAKTAKSMRLQKNGKAPAKTGYQEVYE